MRAEILVVAALLSVGCAPSPEVRPARQVREARVERVLGMRPPFSTYGASFDDCGIWSTCVRGDRDSVWIYLDRRPFAPDSAGMPPSTWGHIWIHAYPDSPRAQSLAFRSEAESAVVDLVRLAFESTFSPEEESVLVRKERAASRKPHPEYEALVLSSEMGPRAHALRDLRNFMGSMEWRRTDAP